MSVVELAQEIEASVYRSWKARVCVEYDGWQLRFADGFSRRGNSVYPESLSSLPHGEKLDWCRDWYAQRGLDLVVRQTIASEPGLDEVLDAAGFGQEGRTHVMTRDVVGRGGSLAAASAPTSSWWRTTADLWGFDLERSDGWSAIINRIDLPAAFIAIDGKAAGLAIVDGSWVGLFEIIVAPEIRRSGLGREVTESLLAWGAERGAQRSYLQVVAENTTAIDFYQGLGFEHTYSYWYRRDQPANRPA